MNRFTVNVTPAEFNRVRELAIWLEDEPRNRDLILDILTEAWSQNGGFFVPAVARERVVEEIKLVVI